MPKNCPLGKKGSHDCWECIYSADGCVAERLIAQEVVQQIENTECLKCTHFRVCARHMGGMNLVRCEDYNEELVAQWKTREQYNDYLWVECSNCGFRVENYKAVETGISSTDVTGYRWHACPKCTAHMIVKEEI